MERCPSCSQSTFADGWCTYCGYTQTKPRVLVGQPLADPMPLDPEFIAEVEPLPAEALEVLPLEALEVIEGEPEPLPLDALAIVEGEPLGLVEVQVEERVERMEGLETWERVEVEVATGLEGLETTELDPRGVKDKAPPSEGPVVFQYRVCPGCQAEQPDPPPAFCDNCGERLKLKAKGKGKGQDDGDRIKCRECGVPNKTDAGNCINCGFKLKVGI